MKKFLFPGVLAPRHGRFLLCRPRHPPRPNPRAAQVPAAARDAAASIDPEKIRAHVAFWPAISRGPRSGHARGRNAAKYIATQFALAGAKPAGDNGTYFQAVPFMAVHTDADKTTLPLPATGAPIPLKTARIT